MMSCSPFCECKRDRHVVSQHEVALAMPSGVLGYTPCGPTDRGGLETMNRLTPPPAAAAHHSPGSLRQGARADLRELRHP
eukprot:2789886-Pyramimonas_sp.AAC.1